MNRRDFPPGTLALAGAVLLGCGGRSSDVVEGGPPRLEGNVSASAGSDVVAWNLGGTASGGTASGGTASGGTASGGGGAAAGSGAEAPQDGVEPGGERCGNGSMDAGEACDDGNALDGDGCSRRCIIESSWLPVPVRVIVCGDAVLEATESCDDGNVRSGDGCSESCGVEPGYYCPVPGEACLVELESCGNGIIEPELGEDCDLGAANNDGAYGGCNPDCSLGPRCGDGELQEPEQCDEGGANGGPTCTAFCSVVPPPM